MESFSNGYFVVLFFFCGFVVNTVRAFPPFQPIAMLGGAIWCCGNICVVPVIKTIGMGLGLLLWGIISLSTGWLTSNFGLFGLNAKVANVPWLNTLGFILTIVSAVAFSFVKSDLSSQTDDTKLLNDEYLDGNSEKDFFESLSPGMKRVVGISLSIFSGMMYGSNFDPPQYLIDHDMGSKNGMDYVFSHFTGIFLTSTFFMITYSLIKQNKPNLYPNIVVPGFISGILWAIGQICFFGANSNLPFVVTFPIIGSGPGIVGALWGIIVFKEISGSRNMLYFLIATILAGVGITFIVLSSVLAKVS